MRIKDYGYSYLQANTSNLSFQVRGFISFLSAVNWEGSILLGVLGDVHSTVQSNFFLQ